MLRQNRSTESVAAGGVDSFKVESPRNNSSSIVVDRRERSKIEKQHIIILKVINLKVLKLTFGFLNLYLMICDFLNLLTEKMMKNEKRYWTTTNQL